MAFRAERRPGHGRRSKLDIVGDVLRVVSEGSERPTNVMFRANLTWPLTLAYIELLLRHKLLSTEEVGSKSVYRITPKGSELLRSFVRLEEDAAELELDRFDSALVANLMSKPKAKSGAVSLGEIRRAMAAKGYAEAEPTVRGLSGTTHSFDLLLEDGGGRRVGYFVVDRAAIGDVIRAFIIQNDSELQVKLVSRNPPDEDADALSKSYRVELATVG
ncbi:MAG: hypothetical protein JRM80_13280 [Nitrososphaerota archaeon]|nr:hypothetical protein [Nitrososphaerota archaeon]MDG7011228.1 hypothetical protein [Nitrososphaerota archaeon]